MLEEPPVNDRLHVEVHSTSSRIGLLHPKVYNICYVCTHSVSSNQGNEAYYIF